MGKYGVKEERGRKLDKKQQHIFRNGDVMRKQEGKFCGWFSVSIYQVWCESIIYESDQRETGNEYQ